MRYEDVFQCFFLRRSIDSRDSFNDSWIKFPIHCHLIACGPLRRSKNPQESQRISLLLPRDSKETARILEILFRFTKPIVADYRRIPLPRLAIVQETDSDTSTLATLADSRDSLRILVERFKSFRSWWPMGHWQDQRILKNPQESSRISLFLPFLRILKRLWGFQNDSEFSKRSEMASVPSFLNWIIFKYYSSPSERVVSNRKRKRDSASLVWTRRPVRKAGLEILPLSRNRNEPSERPQRR